MIKETLRNAMLNERIDDGKRYNPTKHIIIIWSIDDVLSIRPNLTEEQAMDVLMLAKRRHDANEGINWDTLTCWADEVYPEPEETEADEDGITW